MARVIDLIFHDVNLRSLLLGMDGRTRYTLHNLPAQARFLQWTYPSRTFRTNDPLFYREPFGARIESPELDDIPDGSAVPCRMARVENTTSARYWDSGLKNVADEAEKVLARNYERGSLSDNLFMAKQDATEMAQCLLRVIEDLALLREENDRLRSIFSCDFSHESDIARLSREQGWYEAQNQRDLDAQRTYANQVPLGGPSSVG